MLRHIVLDDFKGFARAEATIAPFTLCVGANASGKSNFLDAMRFLHGLGHGWPIADVLGGRVEGGTRVWRGIRGGSREVTRSGAPHFRVTSDWLILGDNYHHVIESDGRETLHEEIHNLFVANRAPAEAVDNGLSVEWLQGSLHPQTVPEDASRSATSSPLALTNAFARYFAPTLRMMRFLDLQVTAMRDYSQKREGARLADDGSNLSSVMWAACQNEDRRREFVDWLTELCSSEIADIDFDETDSGDVLLRVIEHGGTRITARNLSDGTLRFLGLLAALRTLRSGETLVIEDLDHGLHPSRLALLVQAIGQATHWSHAEYHARTVIATTHSPTLLEAAMGLEESPTAHPNSRHPSLLLFARLGGGRGSTISDIRSLPHLDEVRKRRDFHYLLNTGWLERAL